MNLSTPTFTQEVDGFGNPNGILDIAVNASVPAPTYFMQIFGITNVTVTGTGTATRRGTVMILVLDTSTSMNTPTVPTACNAMKSAAQQFITNFSPYDTIGVVQFGYTASVLYPPSTNFGNGTLNTDLGNITCQDNTNTTSGLWLAYEQIKSVGLPLAYNSIVLFTDGSPNGVSANFPVRTQSDVRWGMDYTQYDTAPFNPATNPAPIATCTGTGNPNGSPAPCTMPVICTGSSTQTVTGTLPQTQGQPDEGTTSGLFRPVSTDAWASYPATCNAKAVSYLPSSSNNAGAQPNVIRQIVAYIPDFDIYGNSTHGVPSTSTPPNCPGPTCTVANVTLTSTGATYYYDTRDFWEFQVNNLCASPSGPAVTPCANTPNTANQQYGGGVWASFPTGGSLGTNFFTAGPYAGYMRPDQPTTIVAATMNTAMSEAYWIRGDASGCGGSGGNGTACPTQYHPVINTIYLTGNAGDAVDHEFLPIMSNTQQITALPYDSSFAPYTNPAFQQTQEQGLYQVTASASQLTVLFSKLASEVLRLSH